MPKDRSVETWLGLLILGIIVGSWLKLPAGLINALVFLFCTSVFLLVAAWLYAFALRRIAPLRQVRFESESVQARLPWRIRWFGRDSFMGVRRYRTKHRRKGAVRALWLLRGSEVLTLLIIPAALGAAVYGLYVEDKWISMGLVLGAPAVGISVVLKLIKISRALALERLKYIAPQAGEALAQDGRRPILWLRSFGSDGSEAACIIDQDVPLTFEQMITEPLSKYGPVVAIGRPGEELPPLGALREYVGDDWQIRVRELLLSAAAVVAILDDTPGLLWELKQIVDLDLHQRLILIIPAGEPEELERKWRAFHEAIGRPCRSALYQPGNTTPRSPLAVVFNADVFPERIIAGERLVEYYRDAVKLGAWYLTRDTMPAAPST